MSASGSKVRLRFPHLTSFRGQCRGDVPTVLKAQLVVPVDGSFFDKPIPAQGNFRCSSTKTARWFPHPTMNRLHLSQSVGRTMPNWTHTCST